MITIPNATETMAERAWRYGLDTQPGRHYSRGWLFQAWAYLDHSAVLFRPLSGEPLCVIHSLDILPFLESVQ